MQFLKQWKPAAIKQEAQGKEKEKADSEAARIARDAKTPKRDSKKELKAERQELEAERQKLEDRQDALVDGLLLLSEHMLEQQQILFDKIRKLEEVCNRPESRAESMESLLKFSKHMEEVLAAKFGDC